MQFIDHQALRLRMEDYQYSHSKSVDKGLYVMDPINLAFEQKLTIYRNARRAVGVVNGTDILALR